MTYGPMSDGVSGFEGGGGTLIRVGVGMLRAMPTRTRRRIGNNVHGGSSETDEDAPVVSYT